MGKHAATIKAIANFGREQEEVTMGIPEETLQAVVDEIACANEAGMSLGEVAASTGLARELVKNAMLDLWRRGDLEHVPSKINRSPEIRMRIPANTPA